MADHMFDKHRRPDAGPVENFKHWVRTLDTRPIEALYCLLTLSWGFSLILGHDVFQHSPSFGPMAAVFSEKWWGSIALFIGSTRCYGLMMGNVTARLFAALGGGFIWGFVWMGSLMAGGIGTGVAVYGVLSTVNDGIAWKLFRSHVSPKPDSTPDPRTEARGVQF